MASEMQLELYRQHRQSLSQFVYFLLTAAGAAIAFSVTQTSTSTMSWSMLPLGIAVSLWGFSFYCGCQHLTYVNQQLFHNNLLAAVQNGQDPDVGGHPARIQVASEVIRGLLDADSEKTRSYGKAQYELLIAGAAFFIAWHVLAMCLREAPQPSANTEPTAVAVHQRGADPVGR